MKRFFIFVPVLTFYSCVKAKTPAVVPLSDTSQVHYETTILRIITENCISCHDAGTGFPLDTREQVKAVAESGQLLGALNASIGSETPYLHMPPYYHLLQEDIDSIQEWKAESYPD
jgi:mono/diheme cytochrome c family protein